MIRTCEQCNNEFDAKRNDARFCSDKCRKRKALGIIGGKASPAEDEATPPDTDEPKPPQPAKSSKQAIPADMPAHMRSGIERGVWSVSDFCKCSGCGKWLSVRDYTHELRGCNGRKGKGIQQSFSSAISGNLTRRGQR